MLAGGDEQSLRGASTRLLAAATEEFAERGFASARIRSIAVAARVNPAATNYYFGGKKGLYKATLKHLAGRLAPFDAEGLMGGCASSPCPMHRSIVAMLKRFTGNTHAVPLAKILAHEALAPSGQLDPVLGEALRPELAMLTSAVGEIDTGIDPDLRESAARSILSQCVLCLFAGATVESGRSTFEMDSEAAEILARQIALLAVGTVKRLGRTPGGGK